MVRSMTGFGRAEQVAADRRISVEIRSVNHRYLEMGMRLPRVLSALEPRIQERIKQEVARGKVSISIGLHGDIDTVVSLKADEAVVARYVEILRGLKDRHGLPGEVDLPTLVGMPGVIAREEGDLPEEAAWELVQEPLADALAAFQSMRSKEGAALARDLLERISGIRDCVDRVSSRVPEVVEATRTRLTERFAEISADLEYNRNRLEMELALYADRSDITEEIVRLRSHCEQFEAYLNRDGSTGRELKFLLEEMHREINTIGSKGQDSDVSRDVIFMKGEVEKIREQVLNVE
jgi:uncharacterized protein (TIGR00255 family)